MPDRASQQRRVKDDTGSDSMSSDNPARHGEGGHKVRPKHAVKHRLQHRVPSTRALGTMKDGHNTKKRHSRDGLEVEPVGDDLGQGRRTASDDIVTSGKSSASKGEWVEEEDPLERLVRVADEREVALTRESSHTSLVGLRDKKMTSGMRRNRSAAEMAKRRLAQHSTALKKSASHTSVNKQGRTSVHFDLGHERDNGGDDDDGWTEASGSASPNLSRSGSVAGGGSGRNSARGASANNSKPPSMSTSPLASRTESRDWTTASTSRRSSQSVGSQPTARHPDAAQITNRLLQRVPSHSVAPQMSAVSATALTHSNSIQQNQSHTNSDGGRSSGTATPYDAPADLISRFKSSGSATPNESPSPFHSHLGLTHGKNEPTSHPQQKGMDSNRRAKSLSNLAQPSADADDEDEGRPLVPRPRKSSGAGSSYFPPTALQSRTQQKLWLQRASSDIESAAPSAAAVGLGLAGLGTRGQKTGIPPLLGSVAFPINDANGRTEIGDPRVRLVLDRTGLAYRAVRRYMDPISRSLIRISLLSDGKAVRVPDNKGKGARTKSDASQKQMAKSERGLSQSLREAGSGMLAGLGRGSTEIGRSGGQPRSFDGPGSVESAGGNGRGEDGEETEAILRRLWEQRIERA